MEVIDFFQLDKTTANKIKDEVLGSVVQWERVATDIGIGCGEQRLMAAAFNI